MSSAPKKRLLLVAHNFPPLGSGGVHRPVKFARYLRELGWAVEVLTVKDIRYHAYDASLLDEIRGVVVHRAGSLEPLRLSWLAGWRPAPAPRAVGNSFADLATRARERPAAAVGPAALSYKKISRRLFQPDEQMWWVPFAVARGLRAASRARFDIILSTSPPESCHVVGLALKYLTGAGWVADFRDAWSQHHLKRDLGFINQYINRAGERWVLSAADGVVVNNASMAREFGGRRRRPGRLLTLRNGFDAADMGTPLAKDDGDAFVVVHNGSFRGGRRAREILAAFAQARRRDRAFAARARLYLVGINREDERRAAAAMGLAGVAFDVGYLPHREAVRACQGADVLLLAMAPAEGPAVVPGKLYEYLGVGRPILAAVPPGEARDLLARAAPAAIIVPPDDAGAVADGFLEAFRRWRAGDAGYETAREEVAAFARRPQVARLSAFLNSL